MKMIRERGDFFMEMHQFTDSMSIFSSLESLKEKPPADKGTTFHYAFLEECLNKGIIAQFHWIDTRDMCMDGFTKGSIPRDAIDMVMKGRWMLQLPRKTLQRKAMKM